MILQDVWQLSLGFFPGKGVVIEPVEERVDGVSHWTAPARN